MKLISKIQYKKQDEKPKFEGFDEDPNVDNIKAYERELDLSKGLNKLLDQRLTKTGKLTKSQEDLSAALQGATTRQDQILEIEKAIFKLSQDKTRANTKLTKDLQSQYTVAIKILKAEEQRQKAIDKANENFQAMGDLLQEIAGDIPLIGGLISKFIGMGMESAAEKFNEHMQESLDNIKAATGAAQGLSAVFRGMSGILIGGIIGVFIMMLAFIYKMAKAAQQLNRENSDALASSTRQLNISRQQGKEMLGMVGYAKRYASGLADAFAASREQLGFLPKVTREEAKLMAKLNVDAGISSETIGKMVRQSRKLNMGFDEYVKAQDKNVAKLNKQFNVQFDTAEIMNEMSNIADDTLALIGKQNGGLERQVFLTKKIGLNTAQAAQIARGLLDIESSIEAEMEARALTGKDINFDLARQKALEGDVAGAAEAVLAQVGGIDEFNKMNIIQKEAIAKAAGLEVGELQKSLEVQDNLAAGRQAAGAQDLATRSIIGGGEAAQMREDRLVSKFSELGTKLENFEKKIMNFIGNMTAEQIEAVLVAGFAAVVLAITASLVNSIVGLGRNLRSGFRSLRGTPKGTKLPPTKVPLTKTGKPDMRFKVNKVPPPKGPNVNIKAPPKGPTSGSPFKMPGAPPGAPTPGAPPKPSGGGNIFSRGFNKVMNFGSNVASSVKAKVAPYTPAQLFKKMGPGVFKFLKGIPVLAAAIETIFAGMQIGQLVASGAEPTTIAQGIGKIVMQSIGGLAGGAIASTMTTTIMQAVGSLIPGIGNVGMGLLNAAVGTAVYLAGDAAGRWLAGMVADNVDLTGVGKFVTKTFAPDTYGKIFGDGGDTADDFIWRGGPGGGIQKFNKDDLIIGGTKLRSESGTETAPTSGPMLDEGTINKINGTMTAIASWLSQPLGPKVAITNANGQILGEMIFKDDTGQVQ